MIFKGGTCLRKCYFPDYRFSEDIDITAQKPVDAGQLREAIEAVASELQQALGVDMRAQPPRIETVDAGHRSAGVLPWTAAAHRVATRHQDRYLDW